MQWVCAALCGTAAWSTRLGASDLWSCPAAAGELSVGQLVDLLRGFKASSVPREQEVFACMVHSLFDEYRFFHNYPDKELHTTGEGGEGGGNKGRGGTFRGGMGDGGEGRQEEKACVWVCACVCGRGDPLRRG